MKKTITLNGDLIDSSDFKKKENFMNSQILGFMTSVYFHQTFGVFLFSKPYTAVL